MPQPYDYSLGVPSATESFLGGIQMAQQLRQQKLAAEAQQAKLDAVARAKQFSIDVAAVQKDPSSQALNDLYDKYGTDFGAELDAVSKRLDEKDKRTYSTFLSRAIDAKSRGASAEEVAAIYQEGAIAAKNSGREDIAQKFDAASNMAKDPNLNDDFAARSLLNKFDPDGYKVLYGSEGMTSFQRDLAAGGIDPKSPEGIERSRQYAENRADPWMETEVVNSSGQTVMFRGPKSVYIKTYGVNPPANNNAPKVGEVRGGYRYAGGDPSVKTNWIKVESQVSPAAPASKTITESEAMKIRKSLGGTAFMNWLRKNNIAIVGK